MADLSPTGESRRPRAKAWAAPADAARRRAGVAPELFGAATGRARQLLWQWAIAEVAPGRLLPWLPVAFGLGIALYFAVDR